MLDFFKKNISTVIIVVLCVGGAGVYGYNWWSEYSKPDALAPNIVPSQSKYNVGDTVILKLEHRIKNVARPIVSWKIFDGVSEKTDYTSLDDSCIVFGTGNANKQYLIVASVCYSGRGGFHKDYIVTALIQIGAGPNPPPPPPPPVPPVPPGPPVFPNEKLGLSTFTYREFGKLPLYTKLAMPFSNVFDTFASSNITNSEATLKEVNKANNKVLADLQVSRNDVVVFFNALQIELKNVDDRVGLENPTNLRQCFIEIRDGLRAIR